MTFIGDADVNRFSGTNCIYASGDEMFLGTSPESWTRPVYYAYITHYMYIIFWQVSPSGAVIVHW